MILDAFDKQSALMGGRLMLIKLKSIDQAPKFKSNPARMTSQPGQVAYQVLDKVVVDLHGHEKEIIQSNII